MPSTTTFALFNKRASECRKRLNYLLFLAQPLYKRSKNALGRAGREMKSLRSIVSQLVDLTHSLCYWNTTRGALRLCIWLQTVEARQLVLAVSWEYTLQELASVVWRFDLCAYLALCLAASSVGRFTRKPRAPALFTTARNERNWCILICLRGAGLAN
jgi:hypothetical protein